MMVICITQHLSNIWSSIHEKTKQQGELKKSIAYKKAYSIKLKIFKFSTVYSWYHHKDTTHMCLAAIPQVCHLGRGRE